VLLFAAPAPAAEAVAVDNASTPTLCSETDNVDLRFTSAMVRRFTVEAVHPAYAGTIVADRTTPDFRGCDMSSDPAYPAAPDQITLSQTSGFKVVAITYPSFWRPAAVPVDAGGHPTRFPHLLQLFVKSKDAKTADGFEEVLVLYPPDGYWRARPLPPPNLPASAYGSSFLVGPVETSGPRPFVDIKHVAVDAVTGTFDLELVRGGHATLALNAIDSDHIVLDVNFDAAVAQRPFAVLRSMFVTETNADVARVGWLAPGARAFAEAPVMTFGHAEATELWAGRRLPSRHNTSAPDMILRAFAPQAGR
jgi:hypothetical protein